MSRNLPELINFFTKILLDINKMIFSFLDALALCHSTMKTCTQMCARQLIDILLS